MLLADPPETHDHRKLRLGAGKLTDAAKVLDDVLLIGELGTPRADVRALREAHAELTARRTARGSRGTH
jgi:adenine-specific DNA-methyltransferase